MHRVSSTQRVPLRAARGERTLFRRRLHGRPGHCASRAGQVGRNSRSHFANYTEDWRCQKPCKEMRETSMNDITAVILFILGSVGLVFSLRAWARSRHRDITIADRLLASLLTAGYPPGGEVSHAVDYSSQFLPDHHSVPVHSVLVHPMLAKPGNSEGRNRLMHPLQGQRYSANERGEYEFRCAGRDLDRHRRPLWNLGDCLGSYRVARPLLASGPAPTSCSRKTQF
jgi:hypothetical protein